MTLPTYAESIPPQTVGPPPGAAFGIRAGARILDSVFDVVLGFCSGLVAGIVLGVMQASGSISPEWQHNVQGFSIMTVLLSMLASILYHSFSEGLGGASLGKLVCGLRVVSADGTPCTLKAGRIRSFAYLIDALFFGVVAYMSMQKSPLNQRYGDVWAQTMVIPADQVPAASRRDTGQLAVGLLVGLGVQAVILALAIIVKAMG